MMLKVVPAIASPSPSTSDPREDVNTVILEIIRAGMTGRIDAQAHRRALKENACLFTDFEHFRRLCLNDLRQAFHEDRRARSRMARNRRLTWIAMFRYFAAHAGIKQGIKIVAMDWQGNYACDLIDKARKDDWCTFIRLGEQFGFTESELERSFRVKQVQVA